MHLQINLTSFWGGAEIYSLRLSKLLAKAKTPFHFLCLKDSKLERELLKANIPHTSLKVRNYLDLKASLKIRKLIKDLKTTSILMHSFKDAWIVGPSLWNLKKIKYYGLFHIIGEANKKDPFHWVLYSRFDKVIVTTSLQAKYLRKTIPIPPSKYQVIPYGVDTVFFNPSKKRLSSSDHVSIGLVGRINPDKGQLEFLKSLKILKDEGFKIQGILVGGAHPNAKDYYKKLLDFVEKNQLQKIVSFIDHTDDVSTYMASLDIFVMPSYKETFGIVLIEAMASKTAVLSTNAGGVPEILDFGKSGELVAPKDSVSLAKGLKKLIVNKTYTQTLAESGHLKAQTYYNQDVVLKEWLKLISL